MDNLGQNQWQNWSSNQKAKPKHILFPDSIASLQSFVKEHSKIRVVGAGHSFSPLVNTEETLISLDGLQGLDQYQEEDCQSTLLAGTRLYELDRILTPLQQALINQGDIDQQSIAGAVSTGTHGTGIDLTCLSAFVEGFELLTAEGDLLWCDRDQHMEIFKRGRVSLGSFGVFTKIKLQNRPSYKLKEQIRLCPLDEVMQNIDTWKHQYRHIEFWAFLHSQHVILKTLEETHESLIPRKEDFLSEDTILSLCCELTRFAPALNPYLQRLLNVFIKPTTAIDWSGKIFPTPRNTRFNEMEYQLPVDQGLACLEELLHTLRKKNVAMFFPFEFRYVKGDDIDLSPFHQRDSVSLSIHQYYKQDYKLIFDLVEPILQKYQGRPHWGKLHTMTGAKLSTLYPEWDRFLALRQELDPNRKWLNSHLEALFFAK